LPEDIEVHIVSSNTHSVPNCINPWFTRQAEHILDWAKSVQHPYLAETWTEEQDLLYALARDYFRAFPEKSREMRDLERKQGVLRLDATASTGIEVQVIDLSCMNTKDIDPLLALSCKAKKALLINIDYAFGEQAEHIIHQLILLFGKNITSVNFLGKAGALLGKRGEILVPSAFIEQSHDLFSPVQREDYAELKELRRLSADREVFFGPMLTVMGTLMQNRLMLNFYKRLWKVIGIEMEGVFYHRPVEESKQTGLLDPQTKSRFFYYISDLPLDASHTLSERMKASEGIPPLYTITRHVLRQIFA